MRSDKLRTLETKRARRAKLYAPKLDIHALELELRRETRHDSSNDIHGRLDYRRRATTERIAQW